MKIKLKNFKVWQEKDVDIEKKGVVLLSGKSGKGKTSILDSVAFCLYDTGRNLKTYGKKNMSVEIDFDDFTVRRTKSPNLLQYIDKEGIIYENEVAQDIINKQFGEFFEEIGYVSQNSFNSFIFKNPSEKLEFIERSLFKDVNIQGIKEKCKENIKELGDKLTGISSNISYLKQKLETEKLPEEVKFPLKMIKGVTIEQLIENQYVKKKNTQIIEKKINKQLDCLNSDISKFDGIINQTNIIKLKIEQKEKDFSTIEKDFTEIKNKIDEVDEKQIIDKITLYKNNKDYIILKQKYEDVCKKYEELKVVEQKEKDEKISEINEKLWKNDDNEESTLEDSENTLSQLNEYKDCMLKLEDYSERKNSLIKEIVKFDNKYSKLDKLDSQYIKTIKQEYSDDVEKIKDELEKLADKLRQYKQYLNILRCPHCKKGVRYSNDKLVESDSADNVAITQDDIKELSKLMDKKTTDMASLIKKQSMTEKYYEKLKSIEESVEQYSSEYEDIRHSSDIQEDIESIKSYINTNKQLERELKILKTKSQSKVLSSYESSMINTKTEMDKLEKNLKISNDESIINEEQYVELSGTLKNFKENTNKYKEIDSKLSRYRKELEELNTEFTLFKENKTNFIKSMNLEDVEEDEDDNSEHIKTIIENKIKELIKARTDNIEKRQNVETIISNIEKYLAYKKEKDKYNSIETELDNLQDEEDKIREDIKISNTLKDKVIQAESLTISTFIDTLSFHVNMYLERFFKDEPVFVNIQNSKENNSKKSSAIKHGIHITVDIKGNECNVDNLSGGERDRIALAFTLALSEMFSNKILLLDECISSLDHETSSQVINGLRDNYKNNLVVVVAHQVNEGLFDSVLKI